MNISKASSSSNIEEELRKSVEELESLKNEVIQSLDQVKSANKEILNELDIKNWIQEVSSIGTIGCVAGKRKSNCVQRLICCNKQSMNLEEDVFEKKTNIANLLAQGKKFISECLTIDQPGIDIIPLGSYVEFDSRKSSLKTIISGLNDKGVRIIGLRGMGGIGKTKLVKKIGKIAQDDKLFDLVVFATVSQTPNIRNIQGAIADMLGLQFKKSSAEDRTDALDLQSNKSSAEDKILSVEERATKLREEIAKVRKILIILDDVWEKIDLGNIGIPSISDHQGCKIILTTRRLEVCQHMNSELEVCLNHLNCDEAWELFCKYAGLNRFRRPKLGTKSIVDQCGGLPLAIAVVGSSLRGRDSVEEYQDVLKKLERSDFIDVESADMEIYPLLKFSYDYLEDEETKKILLLCSFYPEDSLIDLERLTRSAFGLRLFENVDSVSEAREKMVVHIKRLLNASLLSGIQYRQHYFCMAEKIYDTTFKSLLPDIEDLEDSYFPQRFNSSFLDRLAPFVTMHDVIRDVALWISKANGAPFVMPTSQELQRKCLSGNKNATACYLQLNSNSDHIPLQFHYPKLKFLMIDCDESIKYGDNFMDCTNDLQVLLAGYRLMLPISLGNFNSLITLDVHYPRKEYQTSKWTLCMIGKLKNLEILQIRSSYLDSENRKDFFVEFFNVKKDDVIPEEFRELCNLRVLDLSLWRELRSIPCNVLSRLTRLEELYVSYNCFDDPIALNFLPRLTALSGWFRKVKSFPNDFKFRKLQIFYMSCNDYEPWLNRPEVKFERNLELDYLDGNSVKIFEQLLPTLEYLRIDAMEGISNMVPRLDDTGFQNLRQLCLRHCTDLEYFIDNSGTTPVLPSPTSQVLPNLAEITLTGMHQLRKMCNGPPPPNCLGKVKVACIEFCPMLGNVVPDLIPVGPQLEQLTIRFCDALKCIWKLPDQLGKQELIEEETKLELCTKFLEAMVSSFHSLRKMKIHECNELEEIFMPFEFNHRKYDGLLSELVELDLYYLPKLKYIWKGPRQAYSLNNLTNIRLNNCNGLTCLFTSTSVRSLEKLQCLKLVECRALETIIKLDDPFEQTSFLEIKEIHIESCDKLESILPISLVVGDRLPKLKRLFIQKCAELKQVFGDGDVNVAEVGVIKMDKLQFLVLVDLPRLVRLLPENYNLYFPSLSQLKVNTWFMTRLVTKHAGGLIPTEYKILQEEMPANAQIILQPLSLRNDPGVFLDSTEVVEESNKSSKHIFLQHESITSPLRLPIEHPGFIGFNKLQTVTNLSIHRCPELRSLFTLSLLRTLPQLRVLKIVRCNKLDHIVDTNDEDYSSVSESACFPRLERISIEDCNKFRSIWPLSLVEAPSCLQKLQVWGAEKLDYYIRNCPETLKLNYVQTVSIRNCPELKSLFTLSMRRGLPQLRVLEIVRCNKLEHIVDTNDEDYSSVSESACFPRLERISIEDCNKLRSIWPLSLVEALSCLQKLQVKLANKLEYIIGDDERNGNDCREFEVIKLPNLQTLELKRVLRITPDNYLVDCPCLQILCFNKPCYPSGQKEQIWHNSNGLIPIKASQLLDIKSLELNFMKTIHGVFDLEAAQQPVLEKLEVLKLEQFPDLQYIWKGPTRLVSLSNLREIELSYCGAIKILFTISIAQTLWSLKAVTVRNCEKLEHIIEPGALKEFEQIETCFPQLKKFTVRNCKNLQTVFPLSLVSALPELELLEINTCPVLKTIFQDHIGDQRNPTSLEQIHLQNLKTLKLIALPSLRNIVLPSHYMLVCSSLKNLSLLNSKDQEKIQSDFLEEGISLQWQLSRKHNGILPLRVLNEDADIEIENFDAEEVFNLEDCKDEQIEESAFEYLKKLRLSCLPNLKCIWKGSTNSVFLWSLRHITINNCKALESSLFTHKMALTLNCLETIEVYNCNELESIFEEDYAEDHVQLCSLPCLSQLKRITVKRCDKLRTIFPFHQKKKKKEPSSHFPLLNAFQILKIGNVLKIRNAFQILKIGNVLKIRNAFQILKIRNVSKIRNAFQILKIRKALKIRKVLQLYPS